MSEQAAKPLPKASWRWPIIIIGLLATHTLLMIIVVLIATGGPSHSVMPNAYERSLQWDAEQAQLRQSEALGWTLVIEADRKPTPIGTRRVSFVLRDAQGAPVPEAVLEVSAFHRSFSKDVHRFRLEQKQDAFSTEMRLRHAGFWEFHCKVIAGERVFVTTLTPWIAEGHAMIAMLWAVLVGSLLGSLHCAGMCGAFVAIASGGDARGQWKAQAGYHLGRLTTYLWMGAAAGALGQLTNLAGSMTGVAHAAAIGAGLVMIAFGLGNLLALWGVGWRKARALSACSTQADATQALVQIGSPGLSSNGQAARSWRTRLHIAALGMPPVPRAVIIGLLTTLLPCGWLYAFVAIAAATASPLSGMAIMVAFWIGTLPVLVGLGTGVSRLLIMQKKFVTALTAGLIVAAGVWTIAGRSMLVPSAVAAAVEPQAQQIVADPTSRPSTLPCCAKP